MTAPTKADLTAMQRAMLTVPGVTLPRFGADGDFGPEFRAAFALVIAKAGGRPIAEGISPSAQPGVIDWDYQLRTDLMRQEGLRLNAYRDTKGIWTIGYGHTGPDVREGVTWTRDKAERALDLDITFHNAETARAFPWSERLDPARRMVLRNWVFNMGVGYKPDPTVWARRKGKGVSSFVNTLAKMQAQDWDGAANGMLASKWADDVGPTRATYLAEIMRRGRLPS